MTYSPNDTEITAHCFHAKETKEKKIQYSFNNT